MSDISAPNLTVNTTFAERDTRRRREPEAEALKHRKQQEEAARFKSRLGNVPLSSEVASLVMEKIRRAFDRRDTALMIASFAGEFCTDAGRSIVNADQPPIFKPHPAEPKPEVPASINTLPKDGRVVYDYWRQHMEPTGFKFSARIIGFRGRKPGGVGLFLSWPKDTAGAR
jgi:hypothetical protein